MLVSAFADDLMTSDTALHVYQNPNAVLDWSVCCPAAVWSLCFSGHAALSSGVDGKISIQFNSIGMVRRFKIYVTFDTMAKCDTEI
jgi:hypothetical protein